MKQAGNKKFAGFHAAKILDTIECQFWQFRLSAAFTKKIENLLMRYEDFYCNLIYLWYNYPREGNS